MLMTFSAAFQSQTGIPGGGHRSPVCEAQRPSGPPFGAPSCTSSLGQRWPDAVGSSRPPLRVSLPRQRGGSDSPHPTGRWNMSAGDAGCLLTCCARLSSYPFINKSTRDSSSTLGWPQTPVGVLLCLTSNLPQPHSSKKLRHRIRVCKPTKVWKQGRGRHFPGVEADVSPRLTTLDFYPLNYRRCDVAPGRLPGRPSPPGAQGPVSQHGTGSLWPTLIVGWPRCPGRWLCPLHLPGLNAPLLVLLWIP